MRHTHSDSITHTYTHTYTHTHTHTQIHTHTYPACSQYTSCSECIIQSPDCAWCNHLVSSSINQSNYRKVSLSQLSLFLFLSLSSRRLLNTQPTQRTSLQLHSVALLMTWWPDSAALERASSTHRARHKSQRCTYYANDLRND